MPDHGLRPGLVTTATLIEHHYKLEMRCRSCGHAIVAQPHELRRMFPKALRLDQASAKLRCRRCGRNHPRMWVWVMGWARKVPKHR